MFNDKYGLTRAVLEGRKTQTRRIITCPNTFRGQHVAGFHVYKRKSDGLISEICMYDEDERDFDEGQFLPIYKEGEIVAVAQRYKDCGGLMEDWIPRWDYISQTVGSINEGWNNKMYVKPSLMPHQIKITNVRIQRLQDISDEDCLKEGIWKAEDVGFEGETYWYAYLANSLFRTSREAYASLIDKVSGKGTWERNPYVFVYDFKLIK